MKASRPDSDRSRCPKVLTWLTKLQTSELIINQREPEMSRTNESLSCNFYTQLILVSWNSRSARKNICVSSLFMQIHVQNVLVAVSLTAIRQQLRETAVGVMEEWGNLWQTVWRPMKVIKMYQTPQSAGCNYYYTDDEDSLCPLHAVSCTWKRRGLLLSKVFEWTLPLQIEQRKRKCVHKKD